MYDSQYTAANRGLSVHQSSSSGTRLRNRQHSPIYTLNDDVLLTIFDIYRLEPNETVNVWLDLRWWYKLVHVCRFWRSIIFASPSRLDLNLVCTNGVPIAKMLAHSPPLPLAIFFHDQHHCAPVAIIKIEADILLALSHRDRVRRIRILAPIANSKKLVEAMDGQFPILECMYFDCGTNVTFPATFQAPNLLRLTLLTYYLPIESRLLTTAAGLVDLQLFETPTSTYCCFLSQLPFLLQLENILIGFESPPLFSDAATQLLRPPVMTQVTLTKLRWLHFMRATNACLEGFVSRVNAPALDKFQVDFTHQFQVTFPHLLQFVQSSKKLIFDDVQLFFGGTSLTVLLSEPAQVRWCRALSPSCNLNPPSYFNFNIPCKPLDRQVTSTANILDIISPILSAVQKVRLRYIGPSWSDDPPQELNDVDRTQWRDLLRHFNNAKLLRIEEYLVKGISQSLQSGDEEPPLEILPKLQVLRFSGRTDSRDAFTAFVNKREVAGNPVDLNWVV